MKIDLHVHTRERSSCARSSTDEMIRAAIRSGLDALVIADHDRLVPQEHLSYLNAKYAPFRVFGGVEVTTRAEHMLVLGVESDRLEQTWWAYRDLYPLVLEQGGFLAVAHPFRFNRARIGIDLDRFPPHALEVFSRNTPVSAASRIEDMARRLEVPLLSNSDAHHASELGAYYNVLEEKPANMKALVAMLKDGAFQPVAPQRRLPVSARSRSSGLGLPWASSESDG